MDHYQVRSLGYGLDGSLYPFFARDIKTGRYTKEQIGEFLAYFLMQWAAIGNYWGQPFYLGGRDGQGNCVVNELSYLILEVYDMLGIYNPKIQIKVSQNTPKSFIYKALKMVQGGNTSIVFCHDEMIVKCLMARGCTYAQALDSAISGCYEYKSKKGGVGISGFYVNLVKPISYVFDNGLDRMTDLQIGLKTGEVTDFSSFEAFYQAYVQQLEASRESLRAEYAAGYDLEEIERQALLLGMIPAEQAQQFSLSFPAEPQEQPQSLWEQICGFFRELVA